MLALASLSGHVLRPISLHSTPSHLANSFSSFTSQFKCPFLGQPFLDLPSSRLAQSPYHSWSLKATPCAILSQQRTQLVFISPVSKNICLSLSSVSSRIVKAGLAALHYGFPTLRTVSGPRKAHRSV